MAKKEKKVISKDEMEMIEMGKFYFLNGKYDEALTEFERVLKVNPKNVDAHYNIGIIKEARNDMSGAQKSYEKVLELDPENITARTHLNKIMGLK